MIARSDATVVPVYFDGANSRLFQLASHLHNTLRMGLLIREFRARIGGACAGCGRRTDCAGKTGAIPA